MPSSTDRPTPYPRVGDRVKHERTGEIGHVEQLWAVPGYESEMPMADVRLLTPRNEPSALTTCAQLDGWRVVSEDVVPFPMSDEWFEMAESFCQAIEEALNNAE